MFHLISAIVLLAGPAMAHDTVQTAGLPNPVMIGEAFLAPKVAWGAAVAVVFIAAVLLVFRYWRGGVAAHLRQLLL